ncbi:MAG: hypothetical protein ACNI25_16325 [Halarcobacter sp.]
MRKLSLFTIVFIFATILVARENPFEPTTAYQEEQARTIEISQVEEDYGLEFQREQQYIADTYEKMQKVGEEEKEKKKDDLTEEKIKKLIQDSQKQTVEKTKEIVEKAVKPNKKTEQIVYVKPRLDVMYEKELLPFVKVEYDNDRIDIISKYKISKKITLPNERKIVLDYTAKENFYTKRATLESTNFKKIAVGNHKKENFFRVVIELADMPEDYEVTYDDTKVSIIKLYQ